MTYVEINGQSYPARISGMLVDQSWDGRGVKTIHLEMSYTDAVSLFADGVPWYILATETVATPRTDADGNLVLDENGDPFIDYTEQEVRYDNSEYSIVGDITVHNNGTVSVKMGKPTDAETLAEVNAEQAEIINILSGGAF